MRQPRSCTMETVLFQSMDGGETQWSIVQIGSDVVIRVKAVGDDWSGRSLAELGFGGDVADLGWDEVRQKVIDIKGAIFAGCFDRKPDPWKCLDRMLKSGCLVPNFVDYLHCSEFASTGIFCKDQASKYIGKFRIANMGHIDADAAFVAVRKWHLREMMEILALSQIHDLNVMLAMDDETILHAYVRILDDPNVFYNENTVTVRFLLALGVDPAARNRAAQTARDVAKQALADSELAEAVLESHLNDMEALSVLEPGNDELNDDGYMYLAQQISWLADGSHYLRQVIDILRIAEEEQWRALAPHRLAAAMATHRRLGAASPLAAVEPALLRAALLADAPAA